MTATVITPFVHKALGVKLTPKGAVGTCTCGFATLPKYVPGKAEVRLQAHVEDWAK